jgi:chaperonin GroEL
MDVLANAVGSTLGPRGQCVIIGEFANGQPHITKDGVTVARNINLSDNGAQAGVQLLREASLKMVGEVGDSTTSATVMAKAFIDKAEEFIKTGSHPCHLKEEVDDAIAKKVRTVSEQPKDWKVGDYIFLEIPREDRE